MVEESIESSNREAMAQFLRDLLALRNDEGREILIRRPRGDPFSPPEGWRLLQVETGELGDFYGPDVIAQEAERLQATLLTDGVKRLRKADRRFGRLLAKNEQRRGTS